MRNLLLTLVLMFSMGTYANETLPTSINFEKGNFFSITTQFNQSLLDKFTEKVLGYDGKELYIYFNTPGGSVVALSRMARLMKGSDIKFTCIANFAASAGFMLFQHCDNRLSFSDGVIMSHNWAGGFRDEAPRNLTMFNTIQSLIDTMEAVAISKMNIDAKEYARLINNNLWMPIQLATKYDAIDGVLDKVTCDRALINQRIRVPSYSYYGRRNGDRYISGCPLIEKVYRKVNKNNNDVYIEVKDMPTKFKMAQKNYKFGQANWIYMVSKNFY